MKINGHGAGSRLRRVLRRFAARPVEDRGEFRRLALQLHYDLPPQDGPRSALLVAPTMSGLCARSSVALAWSLGEELRRPVLLVDASATTAETTNILECAGLRGMVDFVSDPGLPLDELVLATTHENVSFLPAGDAQNLAFLGSPEGLEALLRTAGERYDFVVLSGGAVLNDAMTTALAPRVGCVVLLAIENETRVDDLDAAQDVLAYSRARRVALVLTTPVGGGGWSA